MATVLSNILDTSISNIVFAPDYFFFFYHLSLIVSFIYHLYFLFEQNTLHKKKTLTGNLNCNNTDSRYSNYVIIQLEPVEMRAWVCVTVTLSKINHFLIGCVKKKKKSSRLCIIVYSCVLEPIVLTSAAELTVSSEPPQRCSSALGMGPHLNTSPVYLLTVYVYLLSVNTKTFASQHYLDDNN